MTGLGEHAHEHGHDHHEHGHGHHHSHAPKVSAANVRAIGLATVLTGSFMLVELIGGIISGSLALLADAGHMLTDFLALAMAWGAFILARRPGGERRSYGFDRATVLAAFVNGIAMFPISAWIIWEAIQRLGDPQPVLGVPMLVIAVIGMLVNLLVLYIMTRADRENLNIRAAMLHVMGDLLGSVAAIVAAIVIMATGWTPIDPILSVLVALIILRGGWNIALQSGHILLEGAPEGMEASHISRDLLEHIEGIADIHHVHSWSISVERPVVTLHARLSETGNRNQVCRAIKMRLAEKFSVRHATIEIEDHDGGCAEDMGGGSAHAH